MPDPKPFLRHDTATDLSVELRGRYERAKSARTTVEQMFEEIERYIMPFRGMFFKDAERPVVDDLEKRGLLLKDEEYTHSYPFCWRCSTPLYYNAVPAWFINVQKIKARMLKHNEKINWYPEHLKFGRFLKIAEAAPDWNISRNRFWASPLPIWKCDACERHDVIGSKKELFQKAPDFEGKITDLHRPYIDAVTYACNSCR